MLELHRTTHPLCLRTATTSQKQLCSLPTQGLHRWLTHTAEHLLLCAEKPLLGTFGGGGGINSLFEKMNSMPLYEMGLKVRGDSRQLLLPLLFRAL